MSARYILDDGDQVLRLELSTRGKVIESAEVTLRGALIALALIVALTAVDLGADYAQRDGGLGFFAAYAGGAALLVGLIAGAFKAVSRKRWEMDRRSATARWVVRTIFGHDVEASVPLEHLVGAELRRAASPLSSHRLILRFDDGSVEVLARARDLDELTRIHLAVRRRLAGE